MQPLLSKIQEVGVPDVVNSKWLTSIGFDLKNSPSLVPVLKFIGFLDASGKPTDHWAAYRDSNRAQKVLAEAIHESYVDLFQTYPDANRRSDNDLRSFFRTKTTVGKSAVSKIIATFRRLCEVADFTGVPKKIAVEPESTSPQDTTINGVARQEGIRGQEAGFTVNINIQLTVPETTDKDVYDEFFAALKRHLLS